MKMLGWFALPADAPDGRAHELMAELSRNLTDAGLRLAGAVQINASGGSGKSGDIDLVILGEEDRPIRISQSLGAGASGCRLDLGALESAAARAAARLAGAELIILPKFGAQEALGRGFRGLIGQAAGAGIPVLLHVPGDQRDAFHRFAGEMAEEVAPDRLADWSLAQVTGSQ
jgi:hypothetical protein